MDQYIKYCQECDNKFKTKGIGIINTESGVIEYQDGFSEDTQKILNSSLESGKLNGLNTQFNSIFYKRGFPSIIKIKHDQFSEFIKFLDVTHVLYFIQENMNINYPKIKLELSKLLN